jgi:hypothetical protein
LHLLVEVRRVFVGTTVDESVLYLGDPPVDDVAEGAAGARAGPQLLDDLPVHVIELVKVEVVV